MWQDTSAEKYASLLLSRGLQPAVVRFVGEEAVQDRLGQKAVEEFTVQSWPGREPGRPYPEYKTAVRERRRAVARRRSWKARPFARRLLCHRNSNVTR